MDIKKGNYVMYTEEYVVENSSDVVGEVSADELLLIQEMDRLDTFEYIGYIREGIYEFRYVYSNCGLLDYGCFLHTTDFHELKMVSTEEAMNAINKRDEEDLFNL